VTFISACGYICTNCSKMINVEPTLIRALPDQNRVECPYCHHVDFYDKDSIENMFGKKVIF